MSDDIIDIINPEDENVAPFRVISKLKNNRLIRARLALGYTKLTDAARELGLELTTLSAYECLREMPWSKKTGEWKKSAEEIATAYGISCEDLWPDIIASVKAHALTLEVNEHQVATMMAASEDNERREMLRSAAEKTLATLPKRAAKMLRLRFGFDGDPEGETLKAVGKRYGVQQERVRQVTEKALRDLRHPANSKILKPYAKR